MAYGGNIYNGAGDLAFSDSWASLVHVATVSPRNYGDLNVPAGVADFELPDNCPDDVIPFIQYTGSNPSAVTPNVIAVVNQGHNYSALCRNYQGNLGLWMTPKIGAVYGGIMSWALTFNSTAVTNASSVSTLTLTFSAPWTYNGFPSTVTVPNIPANSGAFVVANMIAAALQSAAGVQTSVNYVPNNKWFTSAVINILPNEKMGWVTPAANTTFASVPAASWTATPSVAFTFATSKATDGRWYNASSHCIIPQIGDVIQYNNADYTITAMSGTPTIPDVYSLDYHQGLTLTTTPALPSTTTAQNYRIKRIKRYVRVFTGNTAAETPNHRMYLFARISSVSGSGYGMRMYDSSGAVTFDSNQRMLVLAGRGITPKTALNYPDSSGAITTITLEEGTIPASYAVHSPYLGGGATSYGVTPTGSTTTTRGCGLHLRRLNSTQMGVYWANNYFTPFTNTGFVGRARLYWDAPFYIIDTSRYPSS